MKTLHSQGKLLMNKQAMLVVFQNTQLYLAEIYQKDL